MPYTRQEFESVWPSLVEELTKDVQQYEPPPAALEWYQRVQQLLPPLNNARLPIALILSSMCHLNSSCLCIIPPIQTYVLSSIRAALFLILDHLPSISHP